MLSPRRPHLLGARKTDPNERHILDAAFTVVDIETTGGRVPEHGITEVAMFRVNGLKIVDSYQTLINPMRSIPPFIIDLTGITEEMVENAPPASEVMPAVRDFIGSTVLVAHYTPFDVPFLAHYVREATGAELRNQTLCTCRLARRILPHLRSKGLTSVAAYCGIQVENRHRAAGDALATAKILMIFLQHLMERGVETLGEVLRLQYGPIHPRLTIQPSFKSR